MTRLRLVPDGNDESGFDLEQLARAFDRVRASRDWMAPIRAEIAAADRLVVERAIIWFTATVPAFDRVPGFPDQLLVRAAGYGGGPWGASGALGAADRAVPRANVPNGR